MLRSIRLYTLLLALALVGTFAGTASRAQAQTYQIDCAILLCLSGGWPASVPCARARTEFIRRITPWPIEPPLQIWRCPMGASYRSVAPPNDPSRFYEIFLSDQDRPRSLSTPTTDHIITEAVVPKLIDPNTGLIAESLALQLAEDRADIDISGPEFNFVRSIRVFDVFIDDDRDDGDCDRYSSIRLGSYGTQGDFDWQRSNRSAVPVAFGPTRSGCSLRVRAVFVEWRDYDGNYGFERVDY